MEDYKKALPLFGIGSGAQVSQFDCFDYSESFIASFSGSLPHWDQRGKLQFVTFRLNDSLPTIKLRAFNELLNKWKHNNQDKKGGKINEEYEALLLQYDHWLNQGYGNCLLSHPKAQKIIENTLLHFDGEKYELYDFIIMPNHVHLIIKPVTHSLREILKSIKGYSARMINMELGRSGKLWQKESFDRLIRNVQDYQSKAEYIKHNGDFIVN